MTTTRSKVIDIQVGDIIEINSDDYKGKATVTFIDWPNLYNHYFFPIQVEVSEGDLHKLDNFNHGQTIRRFNLKEIRGVNTSLPSVDEEGQLSLFDEF